MRKIIFLTIAFTLLLSACSSKPAPESKSAEPRKEEKKEAVQKTGREAFQQMYIMAHGWAADARPYRLESVHTTDSNGKDGKASVWRGGFASAARHGLKGFVWSGSTAEGAPEPGVSSGVEDTYNPSNASTQVFDIAFLKVDSDKAYEVAQKHGGDKLTAGKSPLPVSYVVDWNGRENTLTWHVIYGADNESAKLRVAVNGTTGAFIKIEK